MPKIAPLVVIVPTYNEKGNIERLVEILEHQIFPQLDQKKYTPHILVVDDSSPDDTGDIVKKLCRTYPNLHLLSNKTKAGLGNAYTKGMTYALNELHAEIVFEFDADLSHDPTKIPLMVKTMEKGYDMVLGSRYIPGGSIPSNWGFHRKLLSVCGNLVARILITDFKIHDWTGGFRAIRRNVVAHILPDLDSDEFMGYTFQVGFLLKARRQGVKITEIPFHFKDRTLGKSKMPAEYITRTLEYIVRARVKEITGHRVFKFAAVGVMGAVVQLTTLQLFRSFIPPYEVANFLAIEMAILSNFVWSNLWTFADRKLTAQAIPAKFIQFNLASAGSILIQVVLAFVGKRTIGLVPLFDLPVLRYTIDSGIVMAVTGILLGMMWNFFAYSRIIWKKRTI